MPQEIKLPHDIAAEKAMLGCAMIDYDAAGYVVSNATAEVFYSTGNQAVFRAIEAIYNDGSSPDEIVVASKLESLGQLTKAGGHSYLNELVRSVPSAAMVDGYVTIVRDKHHARQLIAAGTSLLSDLRDSMPAADARAAHEERLRSTDREDRNEISIGEVLSHAEEMPQVFDCGLDAVKNGPGGLYEGLNIFCGPPGAGKTALALQLVARAVKCGHRVHIFSSDQSRDALARKIWAQHSRRPWQKLVRDKKFDDVCRWPVVFDRRRMELGRILSRMRLKAATGVKWFLIDYLQLIHVPGKADTWLKAEMAAEELKSASQSLEAFTLLIARDTKAQEINQEKVAGGRGVQNAADQTWYIEPVDQSLRKVIVLKSRMARTGEFHLRFDGALSSFWDIDGHSPTPF
jgi:replicative DNA helicase